MKHVIDKVRTIDLNDVNVIKLLFLFVLQSASDYFYLPNNKECEDVKIKCCVELLKPLVKNDEKLCKQIIDLVICNVKKSTFYRRNKRCIGKIFFSLYRRLVHQF